MSLSQLALKRWLNLVPVLVLLVAIYGTAVTSLLEKESSVLIPAVPRLADDWDSLRRYDKLQERRLRAGSVSVPVDKPAERITQTIPDTYAVPVDRKAPAPEILRNAELQPKAPARKPAPPATEYEKVKVVATGYTAGIESTGKRPGHPAYGITFSGVKVRRDHVSTIAADPRVFPIGTILHIPGYGYGIVADTGSKIKGHKIDLYFETKRDVFRKWGKKSVHVEVIKRGDGKLKESWLRQLNAVVSKESRIPESYLKA